MRALSLSSFTEEERLSLIWASEREALMCVRGFASGELVCRKDEYQLDLCFILRGTVDLYERRADKNPFKVASLSEGAFLASWARRTYAIAMIRSEQRRKLRSRQSPRLRLHFRSSATSATGCLSWDACTIPNRCGDARFLSHPVWTNPGDQRGLGPRLRKAG